MLPNAMQVKAESHHNASSRSAQARDPRQLAAGEPIAVTIARGDGIGPEIMDAVLAILEAAKAPLRYSQASMGEAVYRAGHSAGIAPETWDSIRQSRVLLKAPMTTPQGGGYKSLNVTLRKTLNLYANVRPSKSYAPFVASQHPGMNLVIVRENEEDLYAGIEHQQTPEVTQVLKLVTRPGCERIIRYAFEYARLYGRKKVTAMSKDNIMKHTDGLFHHVFREVAAEYSEIQSDHQIIDIGAARLAAQPERFDVIVTLNLYGDILSDIAAQLAGSVGIAGSANIGPQVAMFEAVHGSAPDIAGKGIANPSGLLVAATQMLVHVGQAEVAELIKNAWLTTLEDGLHPADIYRMGLSHCEISTEGFTKAVIERLGERPTQLTPVRYKSGTIRVAPTRRPRPAKALVGVDVFLDWSTADRDPARLGKAIEAAMPSDWRLKMITNRGVKVYPDGAPETFLTDHWRCRFVPAAGERVDFADVLQLQKQLHEARLEVIKTEHLYTFAGRRSYSLGQGE
jgi:isocitrate dehydrogenase